MRSDLLHIVTVRFNPLRWQAPDRLWRTFAEHVLDAGARLTVVECQLGERPFACEMANVTHVGVRSNSLVWNKEALLNVGIARLPDEARYIATYDSDIRHRKSGWAAEIVHALQIYPVVQTWDTCYDLGPDDEHLQAHRSFCKLYHDRKPIVPSGRAGYEFAHPGYAWAWRREALEHLGGLFEMAALGAGDHHMALGLIGRAEESLPSGIHPNYRREVLRWQERAERHIRRRIGYVPGTIEHQFHGRKVDRRYVSRWDILTGHAFDPREDLKRNSWGVIELAGNKPELEHEIDLYYRRRHEDANVVA